MMKHLFYLVVLSCLLLFGCQLENLTKPSPTDDNETVSIPDVEEEAEQGERDGEMKEGEISLTEIIHTYQPFTDYDMYHEGTGLGEGMTFLATNEPFVLAHGHQGQAVAFYRILEIVEEENKVAITHDYREESEEFESIHSQLENGISAFEILEQYKVKEPNADIEYFSSTNERDKVTLTDGQELTTLPVRVDDTIYHFAKDHGLVQIHYKSDSVIEMFGEEQIAQQNPHL
ncbi:hypothetical protein ACFFHM_02735 [Halalkalibacter kiskunsagensis]|uniref:Uncharacterized protein n=1 Tax=Halalkalibacter kiskunsagensis TaxID=1548599 RepID=A0ABV6K842_9BACI